MIQETLRLKVLSCIFARTMEVLMKLLCKRIFFGILFSNVQGDFKLGGYFMLVIFIGKSRK